MHALLARPMGGPVAVAAAAAAAATHHRQRALPHHRRREHKQTTQHKQTTRAIATPRERAARDAYLNHMKPCSPVVLPTVTEIFIAW